jgi:hypothetical protein
MLKANIVNIKKQKNMTPKEYLKSLSIDERDNDCPVRSKKVKEYLVPVSFIGVDEDSQNREKDADPNNVSTLAEQISNIGQVLGICVALKIVDDNFLSFVRWGNTRRRSIIKLSESDEYSDNRSVPGMSQEGYIWVSVYEEPPSELKRLQARENNLHLLGNPANIEDNVRSMQDIIADGLLDRDGKRYKDCSDEEKRGRVKEEVKNTMPFFAGKKFPGFWSKFRKKTEQDFQVSTWDNQQAKNHFVKGNPYQVESMSEALPEKKRTTFNCTYVKDGKEVEEKVGLQWFIGHSSVSDGAFLQGSFSHKYIDKTADSVTWVVSLKIGQRVTLSEARQSLINGCKKWNDTLPEGMKFVDRLLFVPQTKPEKDSDKHYAMDVVL